MLSHENMYSTQLSALSQNVIFRKPPQNIEKKSDTEKVTHFPFNNKY